MNGFIKGIIRFSLAHRFVIFFGTALLIAAGVWSFFLTPIETFPDVTNTSAIIISQWAGRSAEEVERFVSIPIETELSSVPKKTSVRSVSLFGLSVVTVIFEDGVDNFTAQTQVSSRLSSVELPDGVEPDLQPPYGPTGEIYRYTLESKTMGATELKTIQDWVIEKQIKAVPGVADVVSFGGRVRAIEVALDPARLIKYDFSAIDIEHALSRSNINVGGDVLRMGNQAIVVRGIALLNEVEDVEKVIVAQEHGVPIRIKDVATVRDTYLPRLGLVGRDAQDDVVEAIVVMRKMEDPSQVLDALHEKIDDLNGHILPKGVKIRPFYDRTTLKNLTMHTVGENVAIGIALVTFILLIFLADWRTTLIVAIVIPLALLFAFICMRLKGMSANLLSIGAIDFGIIIDGAVVMVEGLFVLLAHKAEHMGMLSFNKRAKLSSISKTAVELGKSIFTSKVIIITALLPIFSFQKVEGKLFSPLAWTLGFALLGALIISLTLIPVLCSILLNQNVKERNNPLVNGMTGAFKPALKFALKRPWLMILTGVGGFAFAILIFMARIGSEFLPSLNEGSIYVRASLPYSVSLDASYGYAKKIRKVFDNFPEVRGVISQTGRPNDGTDPTGFFNNEFFVDLYPKEEWKRKITKDQLIEEMQKSLASFEGVNFNFSQPISDNVAEAVSGVKGSLAVKITGDNLKILDQKATQVYKILDKVRGVEDLGVFRNLGQPEFRIELDPQKLALYNVAVADAQSVLEMAIGGRRVSTFYDGARRFQIRIRYDEPFRYSQEQIGALLVPTLSGSKVPLSELAEESLESGTAFLYRESYQRFCAIKFSVRGRDMGGAVAEARANVAKAVNLPEGYSMGWAGEFENQQRAQKQLGIVVPISITVIFLILLFTFGSSIDAGLILLTVPLSLIGGILALWFTGVNFSISAGVGFIALFGVSVQNGVILVNVFREGAGKGLSIRDSVYEGTVSRLRPVVMTALMAALGLLPAAMSTGVGSETQKPLAIVVIGGLITATILTLLVVPGIYMLIHEGHERRRARKRQ